MGFGWKGLFFWGRIGVLAMAGGHDGRWTLGKRVVRLNGFCIAGVRKALLIFKVRIALVVSILTLVILRGLTPLKPVMKVVPADWALADIARAKFKAAPIINVVARTVRLPLPGGLF